MKTNVLIKYKIYNHEDKIMKIYRENITEFHWYRIREIQGMSDQ